MSIADLDPRLALDMKQDKNHILFSGTRILQHTGDKGVARIRCEGCEGEDQKRLYIEG